MVLRNPIPLPLGDMVPPPGLFRHQSIIHGPLHVARVMVHGFVLLDILDVPKEAPRLWAAVYLHDLARTHDGRCHRHGADAVARMEELPAVQALFARGGVRPEDHEAIKTAVTHHSRPQELPDENPHRRLTALLKDADGLDRVRLGDLDPSRLRFPESRTLEPFAQALHDKTQFALRPGPHLFPAVWEIAQDTWGRLGAEHPHRCFL